MGKKMGVNRYLSSGTRSFDVWNVVRTMRKLGKNNIVKTKIVHQIKNG